MINWREKHIGILCGGVSEEREISLLSGKNIYQSLQDRGYQVTLIDMQDPMKMIVDVKARHIDVLFYALHGSPFGEDGKTQLLLDIAGIPYTGSGVEASMMSMNKYWTKLLAKDIGIQTPPYVYWTKETMEQEPSFPLPWICKSIKEGSSVHIFLIKNQGDMEKARNDLRTNQSEAYLVESFIEGREFTVGVLEIEGVLKSLPILEIHTTNEFYDYEAKYTEGKSTLTIVKDLDPKIQVDLENAAKKIHQSLNCLGVSRSDFMWDKNTNQVYFLELNSSPGMTKLSDVPAAVKDWGWDMETLCLAILNSCFVDSDGQIVRR